MEWVINMSSRQLQLTHNETDLAEGLNFSITSKTLPNKDIITTIEDAIKDLEKEKADIHDLCQSKPYTSRLQTS